MKIHKFNSVTVQFSYSIQERDYNFKLSILKLIYHFTNFLYAADFYSLKALNHKIITNLEADYYTRQWYSTYNILRDKSLFHHVKHVFPILNHHLHCCLIIFYLQRLVAEIILK